MYSNVTPGHRRPWPEIVMDLVTVRAEQGTVEPTVEPLRLVSIYACCNAHSRGRSYKFMYKLIA